MSEHDEAARAQTTPARQDAQAVPHYSILVEWSEEDQAYVVFLPEWEERYAMPVASGKTPEEAIARGLNAVENYVQFAREDGTPLPEPRVYAVGR